MKEYFQGLGGILFAIAAVAVLGTSIYMVLGPVNETARRNVIEQSKSFRDGSIRQMRDYQARYAEAKTPEAKSALRALVFQELNSFPEAELPNDLKSFVADLRSGK